MFWQRKPLWKRPDDFKAVIACFLVILGLMAILWYFGEPTYH